MVFSKWFSHRQIIPLLICLVILTLYQMQIFSWSPPVQISILGQNASSPQIAVNKLGDATAIWYRYNGENLIIQSSTKPCGGNWSETPENISQRGYDSFNPQIAIDSSGNITVIWEVIIDGYSMIQTSTKPFHGSWQMNPDTLSPQNQNAFTPQISIDRHGNVTAVWSQCDGNRSIIKASRKLFEGKWQTAPESVSPPGQDGCKPQIAIDAFGNVTVVWHANYDEQSIIQASTRLFNGNWQIVPDKLSCSGENAADPKIIIDPFGNATVVWHQYDGISGMIRASTRPFEGDWQQEPDTLSCKFKKAFAPQIANDSFGNVIVVWESIDPKGRVIQASEKLVGGKWQESPNDLSSPTDNAVNSQIAIDVFGNAIVVWNTYKGFSCIQAVIKPFGKGWQRPEILSNPERSAFDPQLAFTPSNNILVVWIQFDGLSFIQSTCTLMENLL